MQNGRKTSLVLGGLAVTFTALAAAFLGDLPGRPVPPPVVPLVDRAFLSTATVRISYADLVKTKEDLSDFECYTCHQKDKPPVLKYDENQKLVLPKAHRDIVMGHGTHGRNNNCYNCHNESNLLLFQPHDGRDLKFADSTQLCGSCHTPILRDWESGVHGRTSGFWNRTLGPIERKDCVNCHDPHSPKFPGRPPAPGPHQLHGQSPTPAAT